MVPTDCPGTQTVCDGFCDGRVQQELGILSIGNLLISLSLELFMFSRANQQTPVEQIQRSHSNSHSLVSI